jgi:small subunit ribosomal protein S1
MTHPGDYPNDYEDNQDDFDDGEDSKKKSSEFADMLAESFAKPQKKLSVGDKIRGEILVLGKEDVFVSTGTNTDGSLSRRELIGEDGQLTHKVGDILDLYVTQVKRDEIHVSRNATSKNLADDLEDAFDMMLPVEGKVVEICKGGVRVSIKGKIAFCPISQLDFARTETGEEFVGKKLEFLVTQFSEGGRNIVVSRKKLLAESREVSHAAFGEEKREGTVVSGKVKKIEPFGAFVEISPGIEGLLHISEMAWSRVENPNDVVKVGQDIVVKVLKTENKDGKMKISLSLKQTTATPWENLPAHIIEGATVEGKVIRCMKFGAFVEVAPGLEGLVPLSEMSYTKRVMTSDELFKEGEKITVKIKEIHTDTKRMSLSFKDAGEDPWALAAEKFAVGKIVSGKVQRKEPYGLFVTLEEGVVALLPKSKTQDQPGFSIDKVKIGDQIIVQVGELRQSERRISLELPSDENRDDWNGFTANAASTGGSFATLGDKLQKALDKKKK